MKPVIGNTYNLRHTGQFCHCMGNEGLKRFSKGMNEEDRLENYTFVGLLWSELGMRQVFCNLNNNKRTYVMYGNDNNKHIIEKV